MSKLGIHINSWGNSGPILDFIEACRPVVIKTFDANEMCTDTARQYSPHSLFVERVYVEDQPFDHPQQDAAWFFDQMKPAFDKLGNRIDVWEGYNESVLKADTPAQTIDNAKRLNEWYVEWARLMHAQGKKCAAYSFSTANPELDLWQYLIDGAAACDYLALHEYDSPRMDRDTNNFCTRYRQVRQLLPAHARKPLIITECGIDGGTTGVFDKGWKYFTSAADYLEQLKWYDAELMKDDYVIGATIYCFGVDSPRWLTFDLTGQMAKILAAYIAATPTPTPPVEPPPVEPAEPALTKDQARWFAEEAVRRIDANKPGEARDLLVSKVIPWFYI